MKDANINVRVEEWIYDKAKELDVNFSETMRAALISEIEKRRVSNIMHELDKASEGLKKIGIKTIVSDIRHMRETR